MKLEPRDLEHDGETYEGRLNVPADPTDHGVLLVPGAGHGPFGDVFDVVAHHLAGDGHHVYRYDSWTDHDELEAKTLSTLQAELEAGLAVLAEEGCASVSVVAKSFGGGIALSAVPDAVDRIVCWAPAVEVGVDEAGRTMAEDRLGDGESLLIALGDLDHVDVPVRVLRGTADRGVDREAVAAILDRLADGATTELPGENHSFNQRRPAVVAQTRWYLDA